jgi:hypothetical protein
MTNYGSRTSIEGVYYYLEQSLQKRPPIEGQNPVLAKYLENPPYSFVSVIAYNDGYLAIALPHGGLRNRPPLDTLFVFLSKDATEIRRIYAQIPPGIHWINGWGLNPSEVVVGEKTVSFYLYGKKKRAEKGSDQTNEGRYAKRYAYRIQIPVKP